MLRFVLSACLAALPSALTAQSIDDVVAARLLTGWRMDDGRHMAAIELQLAAGWKTYWRVPGDAGIPPRFDWSGSVNVASVAVHWPVPEVFDQNGYRSVGYGGAVVVPLEITPAGRGPDMVLGGDVEIGVCREVCVPVTLAFGSELPASAPSGAEAIRAALADRPMTAAEAGVGAVTCRFDPIDDGMKVSLSVEMAPLAPLEASVVELADPSIWISEPATTREGSRLLAVADLVPPEAAPFPVARRDLRITILGGGRAVDIHGCRAPG